MLTLGAIKFLFFDAPLFVIFLRENRNVRKSSETTGIRRWKSFTSSEKRTIIVMYLMILLTCVIYLERIFVNDIIYKVFFYMKSKDPGVYNKSFGAFSDAHVIIVTNSDFIAGIMQLYLSHWFGSMRTKQNL